MTTPSPYSSLEFPVAGAVPNYRLSLLCILLTKAALMVYVILYAGIGLGPDEAQYWTWSKALDWGYYSKPPGIAWQIWLGTRFFDHTELGVRFGALIIGFLLPWATYFLANRCGLKSVTSFWAGTVMALSPLGILSSMLATTDGGYVLFWTLGFALIISAIKHDTTPNYLLIGLCVLCGALFKWTAFTLWLVVLAIAYFRPHWRHPGILVGMIISLASLIPSLIWNQAHGWVTFRHVWSTNVVGDKSSFVPFSGNFFDFLGAQFALLSPIIGVLLILAYVTIWKEKDKVPMTIRCCAYVSMGIFALYLFFSIFKKIQGNWCVYAYAPAIVTLCWYACDWLFNGKPWLFAGVMLAAFFTSLTLSIPYIQNNSVWPSAPLPYGINPFRHNLGWEKLEKELRASNFDAEQDFLFASRYQTTSVLSFYNENQERAYFFNSEGNRKNQFSFWPQMRDLEVGHTGFFVDIEQAKQVDEPLGPKVRRIKAMLRPYFRQVQFLGRRTLYTSYGKVVKTALVFQCLGYNGKAPEEPERY